MTQRERFTVSRSGPGTRWRIFDNGYSPQGWAFSKREYAEREAALFNKHPHIAYDLMDAMIYFREHGELSRRDKVMS